MISSEKPMKKEHYAKYYAKIKAAAQLLHKPVTDIRLGYPENKCECPACERERRKSRNNYRRRRKSTLPQDPPIPISELPIKRNCLCEACIKRRQHKAIRRLNAKQRKEKELGNTGF